MILRGKAAYTPARLPFLRWLTEGGVNVPPNIRAHLMSEIFASQNAVIMGVLNCLLFNTVAHYLAGGFVFIGFIVIDIALAVFRLLVVRRGAAASALRRPTPTDTYLVTAIGWCALQGAMVFEAMRTCNTVLEVLAACTAMGLIGPICARNYPAPRYALLLVCLCDFPFVTGALMTGNPWMAAVVLETPLLILGSLSVIRRLHAMEVALLEAEYLSQQRAERDALTGLMNRAGLANVLLGLEAAGTRFVLFYLDLDGFKAVNDAMGHPAGDALLQAVAERLKSTMREADTVARLGGDEFVIVAPNLRPGASDAMAASVIRRITDQDYTVGPEGLARIGVSVGYARWPEDGPALDLLRDHADLALYEAKNAGKGVHRRFVGAGVGGGKPGTGWSGVERRAPTASPQSSIVSSPGAKGAM
jgi:diguanylate cyclase (GGDEF)-like protein